MAALWLQQPVLSHPLAVELLRTGHQAPAAGELHCALRVEKLEDKKLGMLALCGMISRLMRKKRVRTSAEHAKLLQRVKAEGYGRRLRTLDDLKHPSYIKGGGFRVSDRDEPWC